MHLLYAVDMKTTPGLTVAKWAGFVFFLLMLVVIFAGISGGRPEPIVFAIASVPLIVALAGIVWHAVAVRR